MPFTPTHVAAILPVSAIVGRALPFSALAIGGMVPDFPLFVPISPAYDSTHSPAGIVTACLPLGMVCLLTYHCLIKRPLLALLPDDLHARCASLETSSIGLTIRSLASASLAIVIGATTHVFWDSFTHEGRWGTRLFPRLNDHLLTIHGYEMPGYKALQYGSTLVLLPGLLLLAALWVVRQEPGSPVGIPSLPKRGKVAVYLITFLIPIIGTVHVFVHHGRTVYANLVHSVTRSGLALGVFLVAYALVYHATVGRDRTSQSS